MTNEERSRIFGRVLMGGAAVQLLLFMGAVLRRSYLAIALPVGFGVAALSPSPSGSGTRWRTRAGRTTRSRRPATGERLATDRHSKSLTLADPAPLPQYCGRGLG